MTMKKNFSIRTEYEKKIKRHIKDLEKRGLDVEKATQGKDIKKLAWSKTTYDNFMERKRLLLRKEQRVSKGYKKEITSTIKKQLSEVDKGTRIILQRNENLIQFKPYDKLNSNQLKDFIEILRNSETIKEVAKRKTSEIAEDFLIKRYFKELRLNDEFTERIKELSKQFGHSLNKLDDFMNEVTREDFKQYTDGDEYLKYEDVDDYQQLMENRLEKMEQLVKNKYGKKYYTQ